MMISESVTTHNSSATPSLEECSESFREVAGAKNGAKRRKDVLSCDP